MVKSFYNEKKNNLVISDHKETWENHNNILVGSWCVHDNFQVKQNYEIANYHWDDTKKIKDDLQFINTLYNFFLSELSKNLNFFHKTNYSENYWEILISKWLQFYLIYFYDRWRIVENIEEKYQNLFSKIIQFHKTRFIPDNTADFSYYTSETDWNHWVISEILDYFPKIKKVFLNHQLVDPDLKKFTKKKSISSDFSLFKYFNSKSVFSQNLIYGKISNYYFRLINRQFSEKIELTKFSNNKKIDLENRGKYLNIKSEKRLSNFEHFLNNQLTNNFPKIFFEDYKSAREKIKKMRLPSNPKYVMTSLDHHFNDLFKIYAGEKKSKGSKLYIFQHGGTYGSSDPCPTEDLDVKISDKYFSWGWKNIKEKKIHPFYCQRYFFKNPKIFKKNYANGIILPITEMPLVPGNIHNGRPRNKMELELYIDYIAKFFTNIDGNIRDKSVVKTFPNHRFNYVRDSLKHKLNKIKIIETNLTTMKYFKNFKIYVETVNSTGYLESLMINFPTILIFNKKYCSFRNSSQHDFDELEKCKILFYCPLEASNFINKNYNNLEKWWCDKKLQLVRKNFCYKYVRISKNPRKEFKKILDN